jgi:hypothetical protein
MSKSSKTKKTSKVRKPKLLLAVLVLTLLFSSLTFGALYLTKQGNLLDHSRAASNEWYVSTSGKSSNNGSKSSPWDLQTALSHPSVVKPGDTIWLNGGTYTGSYRAKLDGSQGYPITVRAIPGQRVILDRAGVNIWMDDATYVNFWGLEITQSSGNRDRTKDQGDDYTAGLWASSGTTKSHHVNFINMIMHDVQFSTFGWYTSQNDSEIYGSLIYQNGSHSLDHGLYVKNYGAAKKITDNIIIDNASHGVHGYTERTTPEQALDNIQIVGNILANNGSIGYDERNGSYGRLSRNILIGGTSGVIAKNIVIRDNSTYHPATSTGTSLNLGYKGGSSNSIISGNYLMGGIFALGGSTSGLSMSNNTIYYSTLEGVSSTGTNNLLTKTKPTGLKKVVRPNRYEDGRANIAIYNWAKSNSVTLTSTDLSGVGLLNGDTYELHNAQNYFGDVIKGTYNGTSIVVPMTGRTVAQPRGISYKPATTFPEFGAFVLIRTGRAATPPTPPPPPPATTNPPSSSTSSRTVNPTADTFVNSASSSSNYGRTTKIGVDATPGKKIGYLKFDTSFLSGKTVTSAKFRIKTVSTSSAASINNMYVYGLANPATSWSETSLTYNNRPALASTPTAVFKPYRANYWYTVDVTKLLSNTSNSALTIGISTTGGDGADFQSRETASKPELVVTYR